ncbi:recombination endonuclease [Synechococcus phage S-H38]|uniref:Recombination endonuclease n=1 Tax=Synechococcus phage S-H38 TaxID=2783673 RepID=A0A873WA78_9CAUD|nr:SbcD-like subunit of palindrome specific endonuclease [Synechococcus phage S-H38]QPB07999.1 recombination endonuclease [Synechococcus phage S-H38]
MKVLVITDQHFGVRNDSLVYVEYYKKFYSKVVIPFIKKFGIQHVLCLGDTFDRRKSVNFNSLEAAKEMWFTPLEEMGVSMTMLVGNHDIYYKNTLRVNSPDLLLGEFGNIQVVDVPTELNIGDCSILCVPWICDSNRDDTYRLLETSTARLCVGHLEFTGFEAVPGLVMEHGYSPEPFAKFEKVLSGHYHTKSNKKNIHYLGNPYELYWNDYKTRKGFHILDTETLDLKFYRNPYTIFEKIFYNDEIQIDIDQYKDKYVKLVVEEKKDQVKFDKVVSLLYDVGVVDLKIIEDLSVELDEVEHLETEDTLSLLERYIDDSECQADKQSVKDIIKTLYLEACET